MYVDCTYSKFVMNVLLKIFMEFIFFLVSRTVEQSVEYIHVTVVVVLEG
jgi:hypothetical protein